MLQAGVKPTTSVGWQRDRFEVVFHFVQEMPSTEYKYPEEKPFIKTNDLGKWPLQLRKSFSDDDLLVDGT